MAAHNGILACRIPWIEEPGGLQSVGSQRVRHDWETNTHTNWRWFWSLMRLESGHRLGLQSCEGLTGTRDCFQDGSLTWLPSSCWPFAGGPQFLAPWSLSKGLLECSQHSGWLLQRTWCKGNQGKNGSVLYALALEVIRQHFCHILLVLVNFEWWLYKYMNTQGEDHWGLTCRLFAIYSQYIFWDRCTMLPVR